MLAAVVVLGVALLAGQSNHQVIRPNPNVAPSTMGRFDDVHQRNLIEDFRREQAMAYRQAVIAQRIALADQLDQLIATNECGRAVEISRGAGYRDIRDAVAGLCKVNVSADIH